VPLVLLQHFRGNLDSWDPALIDALAVPRPARGTFAVAVPCIVSGWALGGLYLSLGPSLAAQATGSPNLLWGGLVIFLLCGVGAAAAFALRNVGSRATMLAGCLSLLAGMAVTFGAIAATASAVGLLLLRPDAKPNPAVRAVMPPGPGTTPPCPQAMNPGDGEPARTRRPGS
jgi:hypothetical protein